MFNPVKLLKLTFAIFFALLLMLQFLSFPGQFRYMAEQEPENAYLRWPLTFLTFFVIVAIQVCVINLWRLIDNLIENGEIKQRLKYINQSLISIGFIWSVIAIGWVLLVSNADDPGLPVVVTVIECAITAVALLYLVYRQLLMERLND
jgi:hypothetical protein